MKDKLKKSIEMLAVPEKEKEEIFCRVTDQKSRKKYRALQKKFAAVAAGFVVILAGTNWNRIHSMAQNSWVGIKLYVGDRPENDIWEWRGLNILGRAIFKSRQYQIPDDMEKILCQIEHVWIKNHTSVRVEDEVGEYHYLQKRYETRRQAQQELKLSMLELFPGEERETETTLVICDELAEKPAILLTKYLPGEGQKNLLTLRTTVCGGNIESYDSEGRIDAGEYFIKKYVTENGIETYIFSNRFTRSDIDKFYFYFYQSEDGQYYESKEWDSPLYLLVPANSYQALIFHDGIEYELTGAGSIKEMEEILETLE
ncbi:MAG: hypothetical protein Q4F83_10165 [Eubacteriales bacterium]|nr:hypothetical protein [Eubacteriales bacterium]